MPDLRDYNLVREHGTADKTRAWDAQKLIKRSLRVMSLVCTLIRPMLTGVKDNVGIALECVKKRTNSRPDLDDKVKVPVKVNNNTRDGWSAQQYTNHITQQQVIQWKEALKQYKNPNQELIVDKQTYKGGDSMRHETSSSVLVG